MYSFVEAAIIVSNIFKYGALQNLSSSKSLYGKHWCTDIIIQ